MYLHILGSVVIVLYFRGGWNVLTTSREYIKHQSEIYNPREYISYIPSQFPFKFQHAINIYITYNSLSF